MTKAGKTESVVVGVDGSPSAALALAWAARYAEAMGAGLRAVLAWHHPAAAGDPPAGAAAASVTADVGQSWHAALNGAIAAALGDDPPVPVERKVVFGHPAQVLIDESKDADLLVVGSRGHDGSTGMMLGSVSTHCVTHAACPVTVVRGA